MINYHIKQGKSSFEIVPDVKVTEFKAQLESGSLISVLCTCMQARLGGKFHPQYLPVEFIGISRHGK